MKSQINWKPAAIAVAVLAGIFLLVNALISSNNNFKVTHFQEVKQEFTKDGRVVAGWPEVYQVRISPALTWELSKNNTHVWRNIAWIILIVAGVFIGLQAADTFDLGKQGSNNITFVLLIAAFACYIGAYSSAFDNNYRELSKDQYEKVKDDKEALKKLFIDKDYIR